MKRASSTGFLAAWTLANAWSESLGLGSTFVLGRALGPAFEGPPDPALVVSGALAAVGLGALLEGVLVGAAQARVLKLRLPRLSSARWTWATAVGAGLAWLLGMLPGTVLALAADPSQAASPPAEAPASAQYALALLLGAATGPVLGLGQWLVLRRHVRRAGRWVGANALAWALGMLVIFVGMDRLPWESGGIRLVAGIYLVCGTAGAVAGAVHGRVLLHLLRDPLV
jgi:hypothetical protein